MSGLPTVTVIGTLTANPELKWLASGDAVVNLTLASNSRRYDRERGEWVDGATTFLRCSAWREMAEHISESLSKGDRAIATGQLRQRSWETEEGERRSVTELSIDEIGPALRFATAKVAKARRSTAPTSTSGDAWTQPAPTGTGGGFTDEPPF
ncbi:single-stranded DNA-binding protein [Saccharopolyspora rosea]|uniref:Single-stranded DNA-binding protein n=1 Tax=Saccharopolyspora rosea TaxID=524884 RepID=A0ABW3FS78_9PSEU